MKEAREQLLEQRDAAVLLQSTIRGYWIRKEFQEQRDAAIVLQSNWRALQERRHLRRVRNMVSSVTKIQALVSPILSQSFHTKDYDTYLTWGRLEGSLFAGA